MNPDEARRMTALDAVIRLRGADRHYDPEEVVQEARAFEAYLRGDEQGDKACE